MCWSVQQPLLASTIQIPVNSCRSELWPNSIGKWTTLFDAKSLGLVLDDDAWLGWQQHLVRIITSPHSQWNLPVLVCWSHLVRKKEKAVARIRWNVRYWVGRVKFTSVHVEFSICLQSCKTGFGHNYWMKSLSNENWLMLILNGERVNTNFYSPDCLYTAKNVVWSHFPCIKSYFF